jgi:hypothetical protein
MWSMWSRPTSDGSSRHGFRAARHGDLERAARIRHPERDGADRRAVDTREGLREAMGLRVEDEVGAALSVEGDLLRAMPGRDPEAQPLEEGRELAGVGCRVFDELEAVCLDDLLRCHAHVRPSSMWRAGGSRPR